jgi:uncharacterized protein YndB with AHSA1/START domain
MSTELILERVVPLPPEAVWRAWTEPELLKRWFCPLPWQAVEAEMDLRPGGAFRTVMQGPDGTRMTHVGCYLEIDAPHRLVWTNALAPGFVPAAGVSDVPTFTCVLTFEAVEGGTRYTARAMHRDAEAAQAHGKMGFHEGWGIALTQLVQAATQGMKGHVAES